MQILSKSSVQKNLIHEISRLPLIQSKLYHPTGSEWRHDKTSSTSCPAQGRRNNLEALH